MPEDKKLRQAVFIVTPDEEDEAEHIPSWSSQNRAMRALLQGVPQRPPGEERPEFAGVAVSRDSVDRFR